MEPNVNVLSELLDERAISKLLVRFSAAIDTKDFDTYASLFADDGTLTTPWGGHSGRPGLAEFVSNDLGQFTALHHVSAGHLITVSGDTAVARATLLATHVTDDDPSSFWSVGGHYEFSFTRVDSDEWLIQGVTLVPAWRFESPTFQRKAQQS